MGVRPCSSGVSRKRTGETPVPRFMRRTQVFLALWLCTVYVRADDIVGVQPAALDQPRIYVNIRRDQTSAPLATKVDKQSMAAIEAFLDTGASAVVLSNETHQALGLK